MQYSASIDDYERIMKEGNNGGYAKNWLVADRKTNEIASLELGLKNVILKRSKDGFFVGSNLPADAKLSKEETDFDVDGLGFRVLQCQLASTRTNFEGVDYFADKAADKKHQSPPVAGL